MLTAVTMTACWSVVLFFASAGASAAYLTVSEVFPMETRALAIAFFYAIGTATGGITGPLLFSSLVSGGKVSQTVLAFTIGAALMIATGLVEVFLVSTPSASPWKTSPGAVIRSRPRHLPGGAQPGTSRQLT